MQRTEHAERRGAVHRQRLRGGEVVKPRADAVRLRDWRGQFEERPLVMLGLAFGGGLLLASMGRKRSRKRKGSFLAERPDKGAWGEVKSVLFGVLTTAAMGIIEDALPRIKKRMSHRGD